MRKFLTLFLVLVLLFSSCGDNTVASGEGGLKVEVEQIPQEVVDTITADGFRWFNYWDGTLFNSDWVDDEHLLIYSYLEEYTDSGTVLMHTRVFFYSVKKKKVKKIGEIAGSEIQTFKYKDDFYIFSEESKDSIKIYRIDLKKKEVQKVDIKTSFGGVSKTGKILYDNGSTAEIRDLLNPESEVVRFKKHPDYEFYSWSPDSEYVLLCKTERTEFALAYYHMIYNKKGELVYELNCGTSTFGWCKEPNYFYYRNPETSTQWLVNLKTKEETDLVFDRISEVTEPDFSLLWLPRDDYLLNNGYGVFSIFDSETKKRFDFRLGNKDDTGYFASRGLSYNPNNNTIFITGDFHDQEINAAFLLKIVNNGEKKPISEEKRVTATTKNKEGYIKKDFGDFYMWLPEKPSDFGKKYDLWLDDNYEFYFDSFNYNSETCKIKIMSIEDIKDTSQPFLKYDEKFNNRACLIQTLEFDNFTAKRYDLKEKVFDKKEVLDFYTHIYCINTDDRMVVMTFYQRSDEDMDAFEEMLNSFEIKPRDAITPSKINILGGYNGFDWELKDIYSSDIWSIYHDYISDTVPAKERSEKYTIEGADGWFYPAEEFEEFAKNHFDKSPESLSRRIYFPEYDAYQGNYHYLTPYEVTFTDEDIAKDGDIYTIKAKVKYAVEPIRYYTVKKNGEHLIYLSSYTNPLEED